MSYAIDANSILNLVRDLKEDAVEPLENAATASLAYYEIGNGRWKEYNRLEILSLEEADKILTFVGSILKFMKMIHLEVDEKLGEKALQLADKQNITYYDAAYLTISKRSGKPLVTDDEKLRKAAKELRIPVIGSKEFAEL